MCCTNCKCWRTEQQAAPVTHCSQSDCINWLTSRPLVTANDTSSLLYELWEWLFLASGSQFVNYSQRRLGLTLIDLLHRQPRAASCFSRVTLNNILTFAAVTSAELSFQTPSQLSSTDVSSGNGKLNLAQLNSTQHFFITDSDSLRTASRACSWRSRQDT